VPILKAFLFHSTLLLLYTAIGEGFGEEMKEASDIHMAGLSGDMERLPSVNQHGNLVSCHCRMSPIMNAWRR
jgi:hypothetical protein